MIKKQFVMQINFFLTGNHFYGIGTPNEAHQEDQFGMTFFDVRNQYVLLSKILNAFVLLILNKNNSTWILEHFNDLPQIASSTTILDVLRFCDQVL
ncbi:unnamed protein product [Caenorhabditis angaria]|uniref:Uncharacterized protein n=1 Tax=Caenorhabditis angaria TaxID=860376 RepID=A0A9P1IZ75_9PELO|nr:unnamed protein product [Caenorhabditis angaria]